MADALFLGFIVYLVCLFIYESYKKHRDGYVSSRDIKKYYEKKIALDVKHRRKVPTHDKKGNLYTTTKQCADGVGVYSKEYHKELRELKKKHFKHFG